MWRGIVAAQIRVIIAAGHLMNEDRIVMCRGIAARRNSGKRTKTHLVFLHQSFDVKSIVIFSTSPILNNLNLRENNTGLTDWFVTLIIKSYLPVQPLRGFGIDKNSIPRISSGATKLQSLRDCDGWTFSNQHDSDVWTFSDQRDCDARNFPQSTGLWWLNIQQSTASWGLNIQQSTWMWCWTFSDQRDCDGWTFSNQRVVMPERQQSTGCVAWTFSD